MIEGVKSAGRVLEFLEYFAKVQREVSVAELAGHHGYPNSSVSAIMRTLVGRGYLSYDARARTYLPTAQLPFLVDWVGTRLFDKESVRAVMRELSEATGETVILGARNGLRAQYIQVIEATGPVRLHAESGSFRRLTRTAIGLMLLTRLSDADLGRLVRRLNQEVPEAEQERPAEVAAKVAEARRLGYALSVGGVVARGGAIATFLPGGVGDTPLAIAIASIEPVIVKNRDAYVDLMRRAIARHYAAES